MRFVFTAPRYHTNQHFPAKALLDAGHDVSFLVLRRGQSETYEALEPRVLGCSAAFDLLRRLAAKAPGARFVETGGMPPVFGFWREMRNLKPSAVVVRDPNSAYGLLAVLAAKLVGARLILYTQTPLHRRLGRRKRLVRALAPRIAGAACFTPLLGDPGRHEPIDGATRYVPFVIEPQTAPRDRRWFDGGRVNLLAIGKFEPRKNHVMFLEAVGRLSRRHPVRATIVGECTTQAHRIELEEVRRRRAGLGLDDRVEIEVNLPFSAVQERYARHDAFVLASRDEPAAVSPLEAMAHSLPVVCSDANGTKCYVRPGENGFVFRSGDLDDLETCIEAVVKDRGGLVDMGRRSYHLAVTEHAPSRYVDALLAMANGEGRWAGG